MIFILHMISILHISYPCNCDASETWNLNLQDSATASYDSIVDLHDSICYWLVLTIGLVCIMAAIMSYRAISNPNIISMRDMSHGTAIEMIWTILPAIILIAIALPSFRVLYITDEVLSANMTIKAIGHQWYWSYQYDDMLHNIAYDSYMVSSDMLSAGQIRLLEPDAALVLPIGMICRLLATSSDVIHSFAMPSFGLKLDAMPGRLNQSHILAARLGSYYGQCSELCGSYHAFMPIKIDVVSVPMFISWLRSNQ